MLFLKQHLFFRRVEVFKASASDSLVRATQRDQGWRSCSPSHRLLSGAEQVFKAFSSGFSLVSIVLIVFGIFTDAQVGGLIPFSSEDCLYLSVHVPVTQDERPLPVMVTITMINIKSIINGQLMNNQYLHQMPIEGLANWWGLPPWWRRMVKTVLARFLIEGMALEILDTIEEC